MREPLWLINVISMPDSPETIDEADYFDAISEWSEGFTEAIGPEQLGILARTLLGYEVMTQIQAGVLLTQLSLEILERDEPCEPLLDQLDGLVRSTLPAREQEDDMAVLAKENKFVSAVRASPVAQNSKEGMSLLQILSSASKK